MVFVSAALVLSALSLASASAFDGFRLETRQQQNNTIPFPDDDAFYKFPSNLASLKPGAIIRSRSVKISLEGNATQLLYRTSSQNGSAMATVTTVIVPTNGKLQKNKVLAYFFAEDSVATKCAPSYSLRQGASPESAVVQLEQNFAKLYLDQGYTLTIPDYEGINSAFAVGRLNGRHALDSVRAAINYKPAGLSSNAKVAATGYSGASFAGGWFAALKNDYAPELNVVGVSIGGTPANVSQVLEKTDGSLYAGLGFTGVAGLINAYAEFQPLYRQLATATAKAAYEKAKGQCVVGNILDLAFKRVLSKEFNSLGDRLLYQPTVARIVAENVLGVVKSETPTFPIQLYHAIDDEIIPVNGTDYAVKQWCKNGAKSLFYIRVTGASHVSLAATGISQSMNFIVDRFNGKPVVQGCKTVSGTLPQNATSATGAQQAAFIKEWATLASQAQFRA